MIVLTKILNNFQIDKALNLSEKEKKMLDASDFGDLKTAVEHLAKVRSESKELESLKKELVDYVEDLKDLDHIKVGLKQRTKVWIKKKFNDFFDFAEFFKRLNVFF